VSGWTCRLRAALRRASRPAAFATLGSWASVVVLLLADRGGEPGVLVGDEAAPMSSASAAIVVAVGLSITWVGFVLAATTVCWTVGADLENGLEVTYRQAGASLGERLGSSLAAFLLLDAVTVGGIAILVKVAGDRLDGWSGVPGTSRLDLEPRLLLFWLVGAVFWWAAAVLLCLLLRSSAAAAGVMTGLVLTGMLAANRGELAPYLPTVWLGSLGGFGPGGSRLTDVWSDGASALSLRWDGAQGTPALALVAVTSLALCAALVPLARRVGLDASEGV
jgi:hypothetical protein